MDIAVQWSVLRHLWHEIRASRSIIAIAIVLDAVVLGALLYVKAQTDQLVICAAAIGLILIFVGERLFLRAH